MKNRNTFAQQAKLLISTAALAGTLGGWAFFAQQNSAANTNSSEAVPAAAPAAQIPQWLLAKPAIPTLQPITQSAPAAAPPSSSAPAAAAPNLRQVNEVVIPAAPAQQNQVTTTRRTRPAPITSTRTSR